MVIPPILKPKNSTASAMSVAEYILCIANKEPMTAIRLHHLLYYCQGWHLAWFGRPLFHEKIEARIEGPFVTGLSEHDLNGMNGVSSDPMQHITLLDDFAKSVEQVWANYRKFSIAELQNMARQEAPWKDHFRPEESHASSSEIPISAIAAYFGSDYHRLTGDDPGSVDLLESDIEAGRVITHEDLLKEFGC
jgi:uncharacterized phage-associated protein